MPLCRIAGQLVVYGIHWHVLDDVEVVIVINNRNRLEAAPDESTTALVVLIERVSQSRKSAMKGV